MAPSSRSSSLSLEYNADSLFAKRRNAGSDHVRDTEEIWQSTFGLQEATPPPVPCLVNSDKLALGVSTIK
jgi:hypothetical protein